MRNGTTSAGPRPLRAPRVWASRSRALPAWASLSRALPTRVLVACALLALAPEWSRALDVLDVRVEGNESLTRREVAEMVAGGAGAPFEPTRIAAGVDSLVSALAELGRPFATVRAVWDTAGGAVVVAVAVDEGPEVRLKDATLRGVDGPVPEAHTGGLELRSGAVLSGDALEAELTALVAAMADGGLPLARATVPRFAELDADGGLSMELDITSGPAATFGDVLVSGNDSTRERVIVRETGIRTGEPYSASTLAEVRTRLERWGVLGGVSEPVVAVDPATGLATVGIEVVERSNSRISGVLGYAGGGDDDDRVTGLLDIRLGNIAGTGRAASASWERVRENQTEISFSYVEPWLLGAPIDVGVSGAQAVRDTFYTTTEGDLFVEARMGDRTRLTWSLGGERYVPGAEDESTTTSVRTAFAARYDGTDVPWNPTRGVRLGGSFEYAAKEIADTGDRERSGTLRLEAGTFIGVRRRQVLALNAVAAGLASTEDEVPFHELLTLGGARSLRGYREEQFRGNRTALATLEYRFILTRRSRALLFLDAGYYYREGANSAKDTKLGYGIGLRGETRLGTISIDYGLGEGDGLLDGKLHVGIIREF